MYYFYNIENITNNIVISWYKNGIATYCGKHLVLYTIINILCYTSETNIVFCINFTAIKTHINKNIL